VSARVKSATAAQQASGLVTLPLILVAYGQTSGSVLFGQASAGFIIGTLAWLGAALGLMGGARAVTRERLLGVDSGV
jgi:hypothetical protein